MGWVVGTRDQVRAAATELLTALAIPREGQRSNGDAVDGARTTRYCEPRRLVNGQYAAQVKSAHRSHLSPPLDALVVSSLPASEIVSSDWWRPVVMRATQEALPEYVPVGEVTEHLWDTTSADPAGTRYARNDGLREFVVQIVDSSPGDSVVVLWFYGDRLDPNEVAYAQSLLYAAVGLGLATEVVECSYDNGAWIVGGLSPSIAARWPSTWRVFRPGDGATPTGARCVREVVL
jgi:hypothetical protein